MLQLRSDLTEDERTALEDAVTTPDIVLYMAAAQAANTPAGQNSMGMTGLAEMPSAAADADTETVTPTAADLDTVCSQFAAMSQMPGFDRSNRTRGACSTTIPKSRYRPRSQSGSTPRL